MSNPEAQILYNPAELRNFDHPQQLICKHSQVDKIVGKGAPEDFVQKLEGVANSHHDQLVVDVIRAYFFGARFIVEVQQICNF